MPSSRSRIPEATRAIVEKVKAKIREFIKLALNTLLGRKDFQDKAACRISPKKPGSTKPSLLGAVKACAGSCFRADTPWALYRGGEARMEQAWPGRGLATHQPSERPSQRRGRPWWRDRHPDEIRLLRLRLERTKEDSVEAALLRPVEWLAEAGAVSGARIKLNLPELGASGWASVQAVDPCPSLEDVPWPVGIGNCVRPPESSQRCTRFARAVRFWLSACHLTLRNTGEDDRVHPGTWFASTARRRLAVSRG